MLKKSSPFSDATVLEAKIQHNTWQPNVSQSQANSKLIQRIISSNEELIHEQMMKIRQLQKQNSQMELKLKMMEAKYETLVEFATFKAMPQSIINLTYQNQAECRSGVSPKQATINISQMIQKIIELQQKLSAVKVQLAVKANQLEATKFHFHHQESGKKSRKTSISEDSIENNTRLFQSRINQYNNQGQNKIEGQSKELIASWNKIYDQYGTSDQKLHRFKQKSHNLIKKFIPHQLRTKIWLICLQNKLGTTISLYKQLQQRRQKGWVSEKVRNQIDKDIKRSFSVKTHRQISSKIIVEVVQLLQLFHIYRPDIGYIQGMTYPALVLIPIIGKAQAFNLLCNLILGNSFFRKLFCMQGNYLTTVCRVFELILQESFPYLSRRFKELVIHSQIYLIEWLFSLFSRGLTIETTLKFWDHLLYFEEITIFRMALAIFEQLGPIILELNFEQTLSLLRQYAVNIQEGKLLQSLASSKLTREKIQKYFSRVKIGN